MTQEQEVFTNEEHHLMMQEIISRATFTEDENELFDIPIAYVKEWTPGEVLRKGQVIKRHGVKYLIVILNDTIVASEHVYPETITARGIYKPFQGTKGLYNWVYGERIVLGMKRVYEGVTYIAQMSVNDPEATQTLPIYLKNVWHEEVIEEVGSV